MDENIKYIKLYDIYGKLLTIKQQKTFELYYMCDLSLREIAENNKISFQAVRDCLEVSKKQLINFEEIIQMNKLKENIETLKHVVAEENINSVKIDKILNKI